MYVRRAKSNGQRGGGGEKKFFVFFDPDETGDLAGGSRNRRNFAESGENRVPEWGRVT